MTLKEVSSVIDDINEWENPRGGYVYYVTAMFTDESVGSVGKKTKADAELVQRQLQDAIGEPLEFTLEDGGISQGGRQKWKIRDFGAPNGIQGGGDLGGDRTHTGGDRSTRSVGRPPEHDVDASIRAAVALKAAVNYLQGSKVSSLGVIEFAEYFDAWLAKKASEPASSAYAPPVVDASTSTSPAGVGSEQSSPVEYGEPGKAKGLSGRDTPTGSSGPTGDDREEGGGVAEGETAVENPSSSHIHDWQPHPNLRGKLKCAGCDAMRSKEVVK